MGCTEGCMYELASNYNPNATYDNGSCDTYFSEILGCTDTIACNYNEDANTENNSCEYPSLGYDCEGICIVDTDGDGVCDANEVVGCMDSTASNFNPSASEQDESCTYYPDCQNLIYPAGWSLFSTYIIANDMDITNILNPINENIMLCKDNSGNVYWPQFSFNGISDILIGQGYQIKTNTICGFNLCGEYALPNENLIELIPGWNMIGY